MNVIRPDQTSSFWAQVKRDAHGCWEWLGRRSSKGYGHFGRQFAHRLAWELAHGPIAAGMMVCHKCDNPPCTRPDHLFLGTNADNVADSVAKGRRCHGDEHPMRKNSELIRGERHGRHRLTEIDIIDIRTVAAMGGRTRDIVAAYGISTVHACDIIAGRAWTHL